MADRVVYFGNGLVVRIERNEHKQPAPGAALVNTVFAQALGLQAGD